MLKFLRRLFCRHTHGRLVAIEWDGAAVYLCEACGKYIRKPLQPIKRKEAALGHDEKRAR